MPQFVYLLRYGIQFLFRHETSKKDVKGVSRDQDIQIEQWRDRSYCLHKQGKSNQQAQGLKEVKVYVHA